MFKTGKYVYDKLNNERVQILAANEVWGFVSYKVFNPSDGSVYKIAADGLASAQSETNYNDSYLRYVALLSKIKDEISGGVLSKLSSGIIPLPHQLHVLNRAISNNNIRYILADEVGLGKTIEAGLIITELKTRGLIRRILVVCPTGLVTQWSLEMQEKFGEKFHIILPGEYDTIRKITNSDDIYGQFDQVISPMDSIKPLERRVGWTEERIEKHNEERIYSIINSGWDLVVIDEAHRVAGSSGEVARHKLGSLLSTASPYLLLLTATPHNGKTEQFLRLIRLIDEKAFPSFKAVVKEQVAPYVIRTEKRDAIDNNGDLLFKSRTTKAINLHWDERHSMQRQLYGMVSDYVSKNYNKDMRSRGKNMWFIFLLIMMQRLVTSSTSAVRESLERRIHVLEQQGMRAQTMTNEEFTAMELEENMEDAITAISFDIDDEIKQLNEMVALAKQAEYQYFDVKIEPLLQIIDELFSEDRNRKVIVFTEFVATQTYLTNLLKKHGYKISILNGSMNINERNVVLNGFRTHTDILISTDAGGEGLNLQFSNCVINYDLPWNPMKIEQRIGRVDRIGQLRDVIAFNFVLADTIESRVREILEEKLSTILKELGIDKYSDVLDGETAEINFTDAYMSSILNPENVEYSVRPIEDDLIKQVQNTAKIKELIREEKNLQSFVGTDMSFDLDNALRLMVTYYENSKGTPVFLADNYSINEPIIVRHLNRDIEQDIGIPLLHVSIRDFPNEKGYFMLWELSVSIDNQSRRFVPIFMNEDLVLRPLAGKKIWEAMLDPAKTVSVSEGNTIAVDIWARLLLASQNFAYDPFLALKDETLHKLEETYRKYMYALNLRIDAAKNIGIETIRQHRLTHLVKEQNVVTDEYEAGQKIYPEFKPVLVVRME